LPDTTQLLSQFYIKINGSPASDAMMLNLVEATVENSLHLPDVATLTLHDPNGQWVDDASLAPGSTLTVGAKSGSSDGELFDGEIVELESDFSPGERRVVVRAFDRLHRLARGRKVKSYLNMTDGDIIQKIASETSLQVTVGPTPTVHDYVLQDNVTNLEFLQGRAALLGYLLYVRGKTLHCEAYGSQNGSIVLTYGEELREFHPRLSTVNQVSGATASGWDPKSVQAIVGQASEDNSSPGIGSDVQHGGKVASKAFGDATILVADRPIRTQAVADKLAQATLDRRAGRFVEADGTTHGVPTLLAGTQVQLKNLGTRFSGKYYVTSTTHTYGAEVGYVTKFLVSGFQPTSLLSLVGPDNDGLATPRIGLVVGVVTDNNDPEGMGRVKVKYPWLSQNDASDWARVVVPGGGAQRGMQFLPEVNDEVLVGFEQGDINFPYVIGGLWNGNDAPPKKNSEIVASSGKVNQRIIRSRTGHIITLDDSDDAPSITIVDKTEKNKIVLDSQNNKLTVHFEGDMVFEAPNGDIGIKAKTITAEATNAMSLKGQTVAAEGQQTFDIKAGTGLTLKGATADMEAQQAATVKGLTTDVKADTKLSLQGSVTTEVKGAIINIG
jgi:phage protein D